MTAFVGVPSVTRDVFFAWLAWTLMLALKPEVQSRPPRASPAHRYMSIPPLVLWVSIPPRYCGRAVGQTGCLLCLAGVDDYARIETGGAVSPSPSPRAFSTFPSPAHPYMCVIPPPCIVSRRSRGMSYLPGWRGRSCWR
jgi:hypothetical protein